MTSKLIERLINKEYLTERERKEWLNTLLKRETPMKVTDIHVDEFYCPKCHSEISHDKYNSEHPKYCEECGQKLEWGCYNDK